VADFTFDENVARVFSDMIKRSVPGYTEIISSLPLITARYAQEDSNLYDLGCSLGASTLAMRQGVEGKHCKIIAVDNSSAMLNRLRQRVHQDTHKTPVIIREDDICETPVENGSVVVMNFTLQFIPVAKRLPLLTKINAGMRSGGALILSEKLIFTDEKQRILEALQLDFKKANGYSQLEISKKRDAIANVLLPESLDTHKQRLKIAGFNQIIIWFQHFNFVSILAIK
ncbi:MAG: carboxy-S-adenosyl-L-methionine synthase CmoA, partial [Endozoicomonadaceae bacterium]|nr:carboxy-S-adenosyl-L-methionine synthase CmoA [Endozoicomonadaceae bacterium]